MRDLSDFTFKNIDDVSNKRIVLRKYLQLSKYSPTKPLIKRPIYWIILLIFMIGTTLLMKPLNEYLYYPLARKFVFLQSTFFLYVVNFIFLIPIILVISKLFRKIFGGIGATDHEYCISVSDDGIVCDSIISSSTTKWAGIHFVEHTEKGIFILIYCGGFWLPREKFASREEMKSFAELISQKLDHSKKPRSNL